MPNFSFDNQYPEKKKLKWRKERKTLRLNERFTWKYSYHTHFCSHLFFYFRKSDKMKSPMMNAVSFFLVGYE